jgi:hypothetical protein
LEPESWCQKRPRSISSVVMSWPRFSW